MHVHRDQAMGVRHARGGDWQRRQQAAIDQLAAMQFEQLVWSVKQLLKTGGVQQLVLAIAAASVWGCE